MLGECTLNPLRTRGLYSPMRSGSHLAVYRGTFGINIGITEEVHDQANEVYHQTTSEMCLLLQETQS